MLSRRWILIALVVIPSIAQTVKSGTGTVTGHVYCADTNAPARLASVKLEPVSDAAERGSDHPVHRSVGDPPGGVVETTFDGSFTIADVPPGSYYVTASAPGYLAPRPNDEESDDAQPQPPAGKPPLVIPRVDVQADQTATADVVLERGASVSGTVHYDDGSPAFGARVIVLHRYKDKWVPSTSMHSLLSVTRTDDGTDDRGHYRVGGLRSREYLVEVTIMRVDLQHSSPRSTGLIGIDRTELKVYSGDTPHIEDAVPFKLGDGEDRTGEDITIPLSKLHSVSGVVTAAADNHSISVAAVEILEQKNKNVIASAASGFDGKFDIDCVPEGTYLLRVSSASDRQEREVDVGDQSVILSDHIHRYGVLEQTIKVTGDVGNLVLAVPEQKQTATSSNSH